MIPENTASSRRAAIEISRRNSSRAGRAATCGSEPMTEDHRSIPARSTQNSSRNPKEFVRKRRASEFQSLWSSGLLCEIHQAPKCSSGSTRATMPDSNWEAMFRTIALFRKVATGVGARLGFAYPSDLDRRAVDYLQKVRALPRDAARFA